MITYKVLIIGPKNSGKSVFLASMYYSLLIPTSTNFFIEAAEHKKGKILLNQYERLNNEKQWVPANDMTEILEYEFQCYIKTKQGYIEAFKIKYFDYSGGRTNMANIDDGNEYRDLRDSADIHLGLINGESLLHSLQDEGYSSKFYMSEFFPLIADLGKTLKQDKVVHFLISKWDLFSHYNYSIADIRDHLLNYEPFKNFVRNVIEDGGMVRLIPVSSVGFNFIDIIDGEMHPKKGGSLNPYNVDMPLSLALLDPLTKEIEKLKLEEEVRQAEERAENRISIDPYAYLSFWQRLRRSIGLYAERICVRLNISHGFLDQLAKWKSIGDHQAEEVKAERDKILASLREKVINVTDTKSAVDYVQQVFLANAYKMQQDHPGSIIDKV